MMTEARRGTDLPVKPAAEADLILRQEAAVKDLSGAERIDRAAVRDNDFSDKLDDFLFSRRDFIVNKIGNIGIDRHPALA